MDVGYGYAVFSSGRQIYSGSGAINTYSHVFDAEVIGALRGLQQVLILPEAHRRRIWMCIDSTSVIWGLQGNAPISSQWAFLKCHALIDMHNVKIKWSPGHTGILGNEAADKLADKGALSGACDEGLAAEPTYSGIGTTARELRASARSEWWDLMFPKLSKWYKGWQTTYAVRNLQELSLPRHVLHRFLALRTSHGDFEWYHTKFRHPDAKLVCSCGKKKTPDHIVHCRKTKRRFYRWPLRPDLPPRSRAEGLSYLRTLLTDPKSFLKFLEITEFYSKICTR